MKKPFLHTVSLMMAAILLLGTLLLSVRGYSYDQPHKLLQDYLAKR